MHYKMFIIITREIFFNILITFFLLVLSLKKKCKYNFLSLVSWPGIFSLNRRSRDFLLSLRDFAKSGKETILIGAFHYYSICALLRTREQRASYIYLHQIENVTRDISESKQLITPSVNIMKYWFIIPNSCHVSISISWDICLDERHCFATLITNRWSPES